MPLCPGSANPGLIVATVGAYSENANTLSEMLNDGEIRRPQPLGNHQRTCTLITELLSVGLHTGAILTDEGSNEMRASLSKASRKGRETTIVRRIENGSTEPYSPNPRSEFPRAGSWACSMTKSRSQELSEKAEEERRRCRDWLLPFMQDNQPKFLTKDELRGDAMLVLRFTGFDPKRTLEVN